MLDPVVGTITTSLIVTGAFSYMGFSHGRQVAKLTQDFAKERAMLINQIMSGTTGEFLARQRAAEAPATAVTHRDVRTDGYQLDV